MKERFLELNKELLDIYSQFPGNFVIAPNLTASEAIEAFSSNTEDAVYHTESFVSELEKDLVLMKKMLINFKEVTK